jgi:hypothetical protein
LEELNRRVESLIRERVEGMKKPTKDMFKYMDEEDKEY